MYDSDDPISTSASSACSVSRPSSSSSAPFTDSSKAPTAAGAPSTRLFEIRETPNAGRAVFAVQDILEGAVLWRSDDLTLSVLLREYRREVCGQCFSYDYGRDLPVRDQVVGFAFCSEKCRETWMECNGHIGVEAWTAVETFVKKKSKEDSVMVRADPSRPSRKDIAHAWAGVEAQAEMIRAARQAERPKLEQCIEYGNVQLTKQHRKAVSKALQQRISPDIMGFIVGGVVCRYNKPHDWEKVLALAEDKTPYHSADDLQAFTRSYLHLVAILPLQLLPLVTVETIFLLSSRDSHNSFGIRSLEDEGSEFFGYGCWPASSYFNHSCVPNVERTRRGRVWYFTATSHIKSGEELNITYLGGEGRTLSRERRMQTLKETWGFECACKGCEAL